MINNKLPLLDIHRHLDGNVRPQTILDLGRQFNLELPADNIEALIPHVQVIDPEPNLVAFLQKLDWGVKVLGDYDACRRIAIENVEDAIAQNLDSLSFVLAHIIWRKAKAYTRKVLLKRWLMV